MKKLAFGILCIVMAILLMSHNTSAAEFLIDGNSAFVVMFGDAYFCTDVSLPNSVNMNNNKCDSQNNKYWRHTGNMRIESGSSTTNWAFGGIVVSSGSSSLSPGYLTIPIYIVSTQQNPDLANATGFMATPNQSAGYFHTVESKYEQLSESTARIVVTLYHDFTIPANTLIYLCSNSQNGVNATNNPYALNAVWSRGVLGFGVIVGNGIHYGSASMSGSSYDDTQVLNYLYNIYQKLDTISGNSAAAGVEDINEAIESENENISSQTPENISQNGNTENQASTNLIGAFSSFVNALTNVQTGNCNITLAFPEYAGGSQTVNICQNKDKAGNLISVFSSLTLIVFYIPLAIRLLTMIYNEIRSFTNG